MLTPDSYARWRAAPLGALVERLERQVVFDLAGPLAGRRVLDIGTGDGTYAIEAAARGADVTGLDANPAMLEAARARGQARGVSLRLEPGHVERLPFADERFDVVFAVTVLCVVKDPIPVLREIARVLVPGGRLVIGELGRWSVWAAKRRLQSRGRATFWTSAHFWTRRELEHRLAEAGLRVEASRGAIYFPPLAWIARLMAPIDPLLARVGTFGAAFVCVASRKRSLS